jgi:hypothetical protein
MSGTISNIIKKSTPGIWFNLPIPYWLARTNCHTGQFVIHYEINVFTISMNYDDGLYPSERDQYNEKSFPERLKGVFNTLDEAKKAILIYIFENYQWLLTEREIQKIVDTKEQDVEKKWETRLRELAKEHEKMSHPYAATESAEKYIPLPIDPTVIPVIRRIADMMDQIKRLEALQPVHCEDCIHFNPRAGCADHTSLYGFCNERIKNHPKFDQYFDRTSFYCGLGEKKEGAR